VDSPVRLTHADTGATVWILPSPRLHRRLRNAQRRFFPESEALVGVASYAATPLRAVARILRQERCDAIMCQEYEHPRFDVCVLFGRMLGVPVFATYQGSNQTRTPIERALRRATVRRCAGLIIPSEAEIVRVQNQQLGVRRVAESLGDAFGLRRKCGCEEHQRHRGPTRHPHGKPLSQCRHVPSPRRSSSPNRSQLHP